MAIGNGSRFWLAFAAMGRHCRLLSSSAETKGKTLDRIRWSSVEATLEPEEPSQETYLVSR
jgi:hypothetical protein